MDSTTSTKSSYDLMEELADLVQSKSDIAQEISILEKRRIQIDELINKKKALIIILEGQTKQKRKEFEDSLIRPQLTYTANLRLVNEINEMEKPMAEKPMTEKELNLEIIR